MAAHFRIRVIVILTLLFLALGRCTVLGYGNKNNARTSATQRSSVIIVNDRALAGPNSAAQSRGGRLFLPIATIAQALGDTLSSDSTLRIVTVRRQSGATAVFNAPLNEVRENGAVILTVSGTAGLVFPPSPNELLLPAEIVAALLDVIVRRDENDAIVITRKGVQVDTVRAGARHARFELFQLEYDYNYSRYTAPGDHSLVLRGTGRVGDARLTFIANTSMGVIYNSTRPRLESGTVTLDRPNGQTFVAGEFGTGTNVEFLSAAVRGGLVQLPFRRMRFDFFGGQTTSGVPDLTKLDPANPRPLSFTPLAFRYDTRIFGAIATTATRDQRQSDFTFSGGAMHFTGPSRKGDMLGGGLRYMSGRNRFQADVGVGQFSGVEGTGTKGTGMAVNLVGSYHLTDDVVVQGRYAYVGQRFLTPQSGLHEPTNLAAAGVSWQPRRWITAGLSASTATMPARFNQFNRYVTATLNLAPGDGSSAMPAIFFSHTQSSTTQLKNSAFTLVTATKRFNRWHMFLNGSRVKTFGDTALNLQGGGNVRLNESNSLELSQAVGSRGVLTGMATWQVSNLFKNRFGFSTGLGYTRSNTAPFQTSQHLSAWMKLPRSSSLQFSYLRTQTGTTALLSLHGLFFSSKRAERAMNGPLKELNSYGAVSGRVYQDVNLNGRFDQGVDQPQTNVRVRVDGSRYVVSDANGNFRVDSVARGEHSVYLDLLSVRADLTLLDNTQQLIMLDSNRDSIVDFRVVRTGRITGVVWLDANENGLFDKGEQPLADVRVVTGSGRDTLTDGNGNFIIGDLPPGEHILLLDEKTIPEQTRSANGSQTVRVVAGNETATVAPVAPVPDQIKKFPRN